MQFQIIRGYSM